MRLFHVFVISFAVLLLSGCTSYKKVSYLQDVETMNDLGDTIAM